MEWINVDEYMPPELKCDEWLIVRLEGNGTDIFYGMGRFDYEICKWYLKWLPSGYAQVLATHWCYPDDIQSDSLIIDEIVNEFKDLKKQKKWIKTDVNGVYKRSYKVASQSTTNK